MTTLTPGQIVTHPKYGNGIIVAIDYGEAVEYAHPDLGVACQSSDLTGWQLVETLRPGHVQVRVDDLGQDGWSQWESNDEDRETPLLRALSRIAKAIAAQSASHTDAPTTESVADSDAPKLTPGQRYLDRQRDVWKVNEDGRLSWPSEVDDPALLLEHPAVEVCFGPLTLIDDAETSSATEGAEASERDPVNHPAHYTSSSARCSCGRTIECIDVVEHMPFCIGNAVKYLWRADLKSDAVEDLRKAGWYIDREIERRTSAQRRGDAQ